MSGTGWFFKMDAAVKRGFAIGFVVLAIAVGYGCEPQIRDYVDGLRNVERLPVAPERPQTAIPPANGAGPQATAPQGDKPAPDAPSGQAAAPQADAPSSPSAAPAGDPAAQPNAVGPATGDSAAAKRREGPKPAFDVVRVEPSGDMVVAGRCVANCSAELLANGKPHAAAKADAQGQWAMTPDPLPPGDYQIALRVRDAEGREQLSEQSLTVAVPTPPSKDVIVVLNEPNAPSRILQRPQAPTAQTRATSAPLEQASTARAPARSQAAPSTTRLSIGAVEAESGRVYAQGAGPSGERLRLYLNNAPVATAIIGGDDRWSLRVERGLAPGDYVVRADQLKRGGETVVARAETRFTYAAPVAGRAEAPAAASPGAPSIGAQPSAPDPSPQATAAGDANPVVAAIETATVKRGDSLWRISRSAYGKGMRYTVIYEANDGQIRNPNLIYPGQVLVVPAGEGTQAGQP
ncbi:LysM peptidoglycan-binding domain-containing protein [Methylopila henanensis]|uniref:LysM peptidoglycan-binding domain-containing protein n=1 Tax=Methylopila henanensis TaxID=873516 RepID=A0ABW4K572_9HYPH